MPTQKRYRKRYNKKKPQGFLQKALPLARKAFKVAKFVANAINAEYKYSEASVAGITPTWNGTLYTMCQPTQGSGATNRNGDSIKIKTLTLRGIIDYNTLGIAEMVRLIIFIDKQNIITTGAQFLQLTGTSMATQSPKNEGNKYDTKVLLDRTFPVSLYRPQYKFNIVMNINKHVHFAAASTTVENGALKMLFISQSPSNSPRFSWYSRTTFVDN